jgi:ribosomal protein S18 acetylase RimI-like enzyme
MATFPANDLVLRRCRLDEADAVLTLWRHAGATVGVTDTLADLRRAIADSPAHVLIAEVGGRIVGSIIGTFDGWRGNIYRLAVHPDHRRRGIARALVAEVQTLFARQGVKRITALVEKDTQMAVAFWTAVGYQPDRRIVRFVQNLDSAPPAADGASG